MPGGGATSGTEVPVAAAFSGRLDHRSGRFLGRPHQDRWVWDRQLASILGYSRPDVSASLRKLLHHVPDDERDLVDGAFQAALGHRQPVVVSCRVHGADGTVRSVLITAEVMEAEPRGLSMAALLEMDGLAAATGPWLAGQLVDLTAPLINATRVATNHAVTEATRHRAVIEQAKGILMGRDRCTAEEAFEMLKRVSQHRNVKLREIAQTVVDSVQKK